MPRILGKASSINVRKVLWTCAEPSIPFVQEDWGTGFQPTGDPRFLALNPHAMVPVIQDGDFTLREPIRPLDDDLPSLQAKSG